MEISEGVNKLEAFNEDTDYEAVHVKADEIIKEFLPKEIREAYEKLEENFWYQLNFLFLSCWSSRSSNSSGFKVCQLNVY